VAKTKGPNIVDSVSEVVYWKEEKIFFRLFESAVGFDFAVRCGRLYLLTSLGKPYILLYQKISTGDSDCIGDSKTTL
jgi:hypothetical protein